MPGQKKGEEHHKFSAFYSKHWSVSSDQLASGLLLGALFLSLVWANSPWKPVFDQIHHLPIHLRVGALILDEPLIAWVNQGLMVFFFLYITLEVRREISCRCLSVRDYLAPPLAGAVGGMLLPAMIYLAINWEQPALIKGWAIPTATDIVLVLGVLSLLGKRVPVNLRLFLVMLAIIDDVGGILIIATFYSSELSFGPLISAAGVLGLLAVLGWLKVFQLWPFVLAGAVLWVLFQGGGIHPTLAGVAVGLALPLGRDRSGHAGPGKSVEDHLKSWVLFGIVPLFAFLNAGVTVLNQATLESIITPAFAGVAAGLFLGKPLGIFAATYFLVWTKWARLPGGITWKILLGGAALAGIGFTMSLFINALAFSGAEAGAARAGILAGSLLSATVGILLLRAWLPGPGATGKAG